MFHLPPGFEIQLIAAEPEIRKPINMNFDAHGNLFVTQSIEYPFPPPETKTPRDEIRVFTDKNQDGIPETAHSYAGELNIPIGVLPLGKTTIGYSIPSIYRFTDENGDGKADKKEVAYKQFGFRDTHGMASSFTYWIDGWVYACHGFSNDSTVQGKDGKAVQMNSGNTYRFKPDGSHIEYYTHGQVNPFGLAFDPWGNMFSADCHSRPIYQLLRGAYYPSFGKPHDGLGYGPEMISHSHGSTGICGVVYYNADQFPKNYDGTVFIGNPVTGRVNHDKLDRTGATYKAVEQPDFVSCEDPWFRPVDIKLAPDGSLYIADFYNKIIGHYEVSLTHPGRDRERGRIWRVVFKGTSQQPAKELRSMPDLPKASCETLVNLLKDPNLEVRTLATQELVARGTTAGENCRDEIVKLTELAKTSNSPGQRMHAVWILERSLGLTNTELKAFAADKSPLVRTQVQKILAERATWSPDEIELARAGLHDQEAFVRKGAADALGRHPTPENVSLLLQAWNETPADDTHLTHVIRIALRDTLQGIPDWTQIANQPQDGPNIAEVCLGIHNERGAEFIAQWMANATEAQPQTNFNADYWYHIARFGNEPSRQTLVNLLTNPEPAKNVAAGTSEYRAIARGLVERSQAIPKQLHPPVLALLKTKLADKNPDVWQEGVDLARDYRILEAVPLLETQLKSHDQQNPKGWGTLAEGLLVLQPDLGITVISEQLIQPQTKQGVRRRAAELLGQTNHPAAVKALESQLTLAPHEVAITIARSLAGQKPGAEFLLKNISEGKASGALLQDTVIQEKLKTSGAADVGPSLEQILKDLPPVDQRIVELIAQRREAYRAGGWTREKGEEVFTKNCAACHRLVGKGNKIGPELDGVGIRGLDRLLEDTLSPNTNVDQAFRATIFAMKDGKVLTGILLRKEGDVFVVADDKGKEQRLPASEIEEQKQVKLSPMPADVAEKIPPAEFGHLIYLLLSSSEKPAPNAAGK